MDKKDMKCESFLTTSEGDLVYINNRGKAWRLVEAYGFDYKSYDIVIAQVGFLFERDGDICFDVDINEEGRSEWFYGAIDFHGLPNEDALEACKSQLNDASRECFKPDAFYTGGGIWCCAMWIDDVHYYCISGYEDNGKIEIEFPNVLPMYDSREDDEDTEFGTMCLISEKSEKDFTPLDHEHYDMLVKELKSVRF